MKAIFLSAATEPFSLDIFVLVLFLKQLSALLCIVSVMFQDSTGPFNSFPASGDFCRLLITFANSLYPSQARQNVGPDLDPNCLTL